MAQTHFILVFYPFILQLYYLFSMGNIHFPIFKILYYDNIFVHIVSFVKPQKFS